MTQEERDELVLICSMMTNYSEEFLANRSVAELERIYNDSMNAAVNA